MKLFIVLVCLLVVATQAMSHPPPGNGTEGHGPMPDFGKELNETERQEIHAEFLEMAHCFIVKCNADRAANKTATFVCMIIGHQRRNCMTSQLRQMGPPGPPHGHMQIPCDIVKAVEENDSAKFEEAYARLERAWVNRRMRNRIHHGMKFIVDHVKGGRFENACKEEEAGKEIEEAEVDL